MEKIEINLKSFPKHSIKVFDGSKLIEQLKIDNGWSIVDELINNDNVFEDIAMKKWLKAIEDNFEIERIEIENR